MAAVVPWVAGGFIDGEFHPLISVILGVFFALPFWKAAQWLASTPYHLIYLGCWTMVGLWALHLLISTVTFAVAKLRRR